MLRILKPLPRARRLSAVLLTAVAGMIATYWEEMNWQGVPAAYGLGETLNFLLGWLLALLVIDRLVFRALLNVSCQDVTKPDCA